MRQFTSSRAVRENVPLLVALIGPSGSGKTFSAHRLARGFARVQPGKIFGVDTEGKRMAELADRFEFERVPFAAPFGSLDYIAAIQHCVERGARTVIVDSMSHEHEGAGGMLETAQAFIDEKLRRDNLDPDSDEGWKRAQSLRMSSFIAPKARRAKLIQYMTQLECNLILCFRAKEKIEPVKGGQPKQLGWMPIGGDEFWYEMTARFLLLPGSEGSPTWSSKNEGEKAAIRLPEQFRGILNGQISEDMGERMARWATGTAGLSLERTLAEAEALSSIEALRVFAQNIATQPWTAEQKTAIRNALNARKVALGTAGQVPAGKAEENADGKGTQQ